MDLPGPSQSQESQNSMDDTFPENTDHFFVTQVWTRPVSAVFLLLLLAEKHDFYSTCALQFTVN